jgi:hypothetical protein
MEPLNNNHVSNVLDIIGLYEAGALRMRENNAQIEREFESCLNNLSEKCKTLEVICSEFEKITISNLA